MKLFNIFKRESKPKTKRCYMGEGSTVIHKHMGWKGTITRCWWGNRGAPCHVNFYINGDIVSKSCTYHELELFSEDSES